MGRPWSEQRIRRELEAFLPGHDTWPTYTQFRSSGRRELWEAITSHGGVARWAHEYGLPYAFKRRAWTDAEIRERLRAVLRGSDVAVWPGRAWLAARAGPRLASAVQRTGGARRWARELGIPLRGAPWTPQRIEEALEQLLQARRAWPSKREFAQAGLVGLYGAIRRGEGHPALAARYGLALQRPARRRPAAGLTPTPFYWGPSLLSPPIAAAGRGRSTSRQEYWKNSSV